MYILQENVFCYPSSTIFDIIYDGFENFYCMLKFGKSPFSEEDTECDLLMCVCKLSCLSIKLMLQKVYTQRRKGSRIGSLFLNSVGICVEPYVSVNTKIGSAVHVISTHYRTRKGVSLWRTVRKSSVVYITCTRNKSNKLRETFLFVKDAYKT